MATRPELRHDESYNRIRLPGDFKSQICSQISDSSESLPLPSVDEEPTTKPDNTATNSVSNAGAQSRLAQSTLSSDIPTPTPEKPNPLELVPTIKQEPPNGALNETPNPTPALTEPLAKRISNMITEEDSDSNGEAPTPIDAGATPSRQTTLSAAGSDNGKRPKMPGRPSTMKRIGSAIRKTISKNN